MRVYYVSSGLQGCYLVRCLLPMIENGWDGDQTALNPRHQKMPEQKSVAAQAADVVVFHRPDTEEKLKLARVLQGLGKTIVFDNDDTYKDAGGFKLNEFMDQERMDRGMERMNKVIDEFVSIADLVTCSTRFLADEYKQLNDNVVVLPNCVDPFYFPEPLKNETDVVRIGISGSLAVTSDLDLIKPIVDHYKDRDDVQFVLFSLPPNDDDKLMRELYAEEYEWIDSAPIEWHTFVPMHEYYDKLNELRLDMAIIPRADNYFNRCKSNLKFMEYAMLEVPVIAQTWLDGESPYDQDAPHLVLAKTHEEWIERIDMLIADKELREKLGKESCEYVKETYSIEKNGHLWDNAYKNVTK